MRKLAVLVTILMVQGLVYAQNAAISYSVHMSQVGWGGYASDGEIAGTTGQNRQIEAIKVRVSSSIAGGVRYDVHSQNIGWGGWQADDAIAGTTGKNLRIEAIRIQLTGNLADAFDVRYQVHMSGIGWGGWSMNGEDAGTTGQNRQLEAIQVRLVPKTNTVSSGNVGVIQFGAESAVITADEKAKLDGIADTLRNSSNKVQLGGYTAMAGSPAGRQRVSQARAKAVADYLIKINAVTSDRVVIRAFGGDQPVADNGTKEGMAANRRVEIILLDN